MKLTMQEIQRHAALVAEQYEQLQEQTPAQLRALIARLERQAPLPVRIAAMVEAAKQALTTQEYRPE